MKMKYRYDGCHNGVMYWESVQHVDSRVEQVKCSWDWFWGTTTKETP